MLLGSIPEATKCVTGSHIYALMITVEEKACERRLALTGHCTDSATNSLAALEILAIPDSLQRMGVKYISLLCSYITPWISIYCIPYTGIFLRH